MEPEMRPADEPAGDDVRLWKPSRPPEHAIDQQAPGGRRHIVERQRRAGPLSSLSAYVAKPMVKVMIAVSLIIAGIIIFDATINRGTWTQRQVVDRPVKQIGPR